MPHFEVRTPRRAARLKLDGSFVVVGRSESLPIFHDDPSLSREHAVIAISGGTVRVRDLGSKNRVFVNGAPLERYGEVALRPGDVVRCGATSLTLRDEGAKGPAAPPAEKPAPAKAADEPPPSEARIDRDGVATSAGEAAAELAVPPDDDEEAELGDLDDGDDDLEVVDDLAATQTDETRAGEDKTTPAP